MRNRPRVVGTSVEAINSAEMLLARILPPSFSAWLLANNSKSLGALTVFPVFDERDPRKTWESIVHHFNNGWKEWIDRLSDSTLDFSVLLPFGEHGTGDYYCFDYATLGQSGEPVVVHWSHETGETTRIADDFKAFLLGEGLT
jgi:hypothetical protein